MVVVVVVVAGCVGMVVVTAVKREETDAAAPVGRPAAWTRVGLASWPVLPDGRLGWGSAVMHMGMWVGSPGGGGEGGGGTNGGDGGFGAKS